MAGTFPPIAALTAENRGPINTIVSVVLSVTSILLAVVRMSMRKQHFTHMERDDTVFGVALSFGILTSVMSHFCVRAGLGKHQNKLDEKQVTHYFKVNESSAPPASY
ncbi:hypothetical protein NX059_011714 [Plenodomus lindquistii]|nr:hypothetical protein NX059_011714 [Plenodomus lindquistii]